MKRREEFQLQEIEEINSKKFARGRHKHKLLFHNYRYLSGIHFKHAERIKDAFVINTQKKNLKIIFLKNFKISFIGEAYTL
jgi:hypothetical protein